MEETYNIYDELYGTTVCIYDKSEKEFIRTNPICRDCLVQAMCIEETYSRIGIRVRMCRRLYKYWLKMNYKNFNKGENNVILH